MKYLKKEAMVSLCLLFISCLTYTFEAPQTQNRDKIRAWMSEMGMIPHGSELNPEKIRAQIPQNIGHVYLPAEKLYTPRVIDGREYATQPWPEDMSEALIEAKIQEAFDYIKNNNIQSIWDPYLKINNFYGYTNDGLLIQYIFDEHMQYIVSVPIFL